MSESKKMTFRSLVSWVLQAIPLVLFGIVVGICVENGKQPEPEFEPCTCPTYPTAARAERALRGMGFDLMKRGHKLQDLELKLEECQKTLKGRPVCAEDDEYLGWNTGIYDLEEAYESLHVISIEFCNREIRAATEFCSGHAEAAEEWWQNAKTAIEALKECRAKRDACESKRCRCEAWGVGPEGDPHCQILDEDAKCVDLPGYRACCEAGVHRGFDPDWAGVKREEPEKID